VSARLQLLARLLLGGVFVVAGAMKVAHPATFFSDLLGFHIRVPEMWLRLLAAGLPWLEVIAGAGLLVNIWSETLRPLVSVLCLGFVLMLGQAVIRGLDLNCGCFGAAGAGWFERPDVALVRAVILFAMSLYVTAGPAPADAKR
jgi:putative oxidoreductase